MSYCVNIENIEKEVQVKGVVDGKEFFVATSGMGNEWKVVVKESFPEDLDKCLNITNLFNRVLVEAKKQRAENQIKNLNFSVANSSKEELENRFDTEVYELGTRDEMSVGEVRSVMFRDNEGKLFEVTYSCYMEYDYTKHIHIDSYKEMD